MKSKVNGMIFRTLKADMKEKETIHDIQEQNLKDLK